MATRWGIVCCGKISNDFVTALSCLPSSDHVITACAARSLESAKAFATKHSIAKAYGDYVELAKDAEVDVVYIGALNPQHFELGKMMMEMNKHVLMEKPLCMNVKQTKELVRIAREKKVFLMEAIWSRFFPAYHRLREELSKGTIGEVLQVTVSFGVDLTGVDRCNSNQLGGGVALDLGVYCAQFASLAFGGVKPERVIAAGHLNNEGVDEAESAVVIYKDGKSATLAIQGKVQMESEAYIYGTKGNIKIPMPFWCPTELVTPAGKESFKLPSFPPASTPHTFNYHNSIGLSYEAQEVRKCLLEGRLESSLMPLEESITIAEILESIRKQIGVTYSSD